MKKLIDLWKTYNLLRNNAGIFKVVTDIFKFLEKVHIEQKPMLCQIAIVNMDKGNKIEDFISLWAGMGESNPIERVRFLKAQNTELKRLLKLSMESDLTDFSKKEIDSALRLFE